MNNKEKLYLAKQANLREWMSRRALYGAGLGAGTGGAAGALVGALQDPDEEEDESRLGNAAKWGLGGAAVGGVLGGGAGAQDGIMGGISQLEEGQKNMPRQVAWGMDDETTARFSGHEAKKMEILEKLLAASGSND
jgi:hypothetical protein